MVKVSLLLNLDLHSGLEMIQSTIAIVPMRHSSERVPSKNYRPCAGKTLYHYIVESLLDCPQITSVCIDTDSETIIDDAKKHFPTVRILVRPKHLRSGEIPMNDVLLNTTSQVDADIYLQTHSTNPLLKTETISKAIDTYLNKPDFDSLFSVTRLYKRLYDSQGQAINHDPNILLRTQDLPPIFEENSNIYIFTKETLLARKNRIGSKPIMFEIDSIEAWDIDDEIDFTIAEILLKQQLANGQF